MNLEFTPTKTKDGSLGLFNNKFQDIYHSSSGAYTEALMKFVEPSGLIEKSKRKNRLKILDICYGLGYNSKAAIDEIWKVNPNCEIAIDLIEIDINILAFSMLLKIEKIDSEILNLFFIEFLKNSSILDIAKSICNIIEFKEFLCPEKCAFIKKVQNGSTNIPHEANKAPLLHNIYYRTNSSRNILASKTAKTKGILTINQYICDLRNALPSLSGGYDAIFHDGFTPMKQPVVWSKEIFDGLYKLLDNDGRLVTYTSSTQVRSAMIEAGFSVEGKYINSKNFGTIAFKKSEKQDIILNEFDNGLLKTKAGIPFYDPNLCFSIEEIVGYRNAIVSRSSRISSSRYRKDFKANEDKKCTI